MQFSIEFLIRILSNFSCFRRRPNHDLTAIYSTFVGCSIFRELGKSPKKDSKKASKMTPKSMQNRFKNRWKNRSRKRTKKTWKMSPKWSQKGSRNFPENPGNRPRGAQGRPRSALGPPKDPQGTPQQPKWRPKTLKSDSNHPQTTPKGLQATHLGSKRLPKGIQKSIKKTPQRNQNSKWKIDAKVIATATPPTRLSNNTVLTMTSARRNARSDWINDFHANIRTSQKGKGKFATL